MYVYVVLLAMCWLAPSDGCDKVRFDKHESVVKSLGYVVVPCPLGKPCSHASVVSGTVVRCMRHAGKRLAMTCTVEKCGAKRSPPFLTTLLTQKSSLLFGLDHTCTHIHCCCFILPTLTKP